MITFEQWSTSWNIYIQSFSYSTAVFYNTFFTQCHLVKYKMPIWNSEIAIVLWGGLNTYIDHFNYVPLRYTAFPRPSRGWYFHLLQSYLFFWALQLEQSNFFLDSNIKNLPLVVCESCVLSTFSTAKIRTCLPPILHQLSRLTFPRGQVKVSAICPD